MHLEYVIVTYETERDVYIDGDAQPAGKTGETLRVETGHHFFDLGQPNDYAPAQTMRVVEKTISTRPMVIEEFEPKKNVI